MDGLGQSTILSPVVGSVVGGVAQRAGLSAGCQTLKPLRAAALSRVLSVPRKNPSKDQNEGRK
jgi:hypothetical protein